MNAPINAAYFRPGLSADEARDEAVSARMNELLAVGGACYPLALDNFDEALNESLAAFPTTNLSRILALNLQTGTSANIELERMARAYWEAKALAQAEEHVDAAVADWNAA